MSNTGHGKTIEKLRNTIDVRLIATKKDFKMDIKTELYVTKTFGNDLVAIRKSKIA